MTNRLSTLSILLKSVNVRLFRTSNAYSSLDLIMVLGLYKTTRLSKEDELYVL
jgi:hypothetical protein